MGQCAIILMWHPEWPTWTSPTGAAIWSGCARIFPLFWLATRWIYQGQEGQGQIHLLPPQEEPPPVLWHLCQVQCQWLLKVVVGHGRDVIILALLSLHKGPFTYYVSRWRGEEGKPKADHCWRGRVSQMLTIADKGGCGSEKFSTKGFFCEQKCR